ncbi:MAG TPA: hypothetical protein VFG50_08740, partial [Rhodothermales bacterium]|nr:hypothetical protein [Rhodothermales bacterium]
MNTITLKHFLPLLALLAPAAARAQVPVTIDAADTGTPISPYIYGQFMEHLGRSIYGGVWAEMLQDRKFYYDVADRYDPWGEASDPNWDAGPFRHLAGSPWRVIGPAGTVTMDTTRAFVGSHTPVVHLTGMEAGISQEGLALVAGKQYEGHVVLAGDPGAAPVQVRLRLDDGRALTHTIDRVTADYQTVPFSFTAPANSDSARLEIVGTGRGALRIGTASLMPADNVDGFRADVLALLRELNAPIYRWPGGNFVSGYDWRDGIGLRDRRPPRKNPAWTGIEPNDVGIHEFMNLMDLLDAEAYIAVNTGLGTIEDVAEEVQYVNGAADTPLGRLRAENGHPEPYGVTWWAVGNEMYGEWQLGHMPLSAYVDKHRAVTEAMWHVDPDIKLVGVGSMGVWSETMLRDAGDHMNAISEHIYSKDKPDVLAHVRQLADMIDERAAAHRAYRDSIP